MGALCRHSLGKYRAHMSAGEFTWLPTLTILYSDIVLPRAARSPLRFSSMTHKRPLRRSADLQCMRQNTLDQATPTYMDIAQSA